MGTNVVKHEVALLIGWIKYWVDAIMTGMKSLPLIGDDTIDKDPRVSVRSSPRRAPLLTSDSNGVANQGKRECFVYRQCTRKRLNEIP